MAVPPRTGKWSARHERIAQKNDRHSWAEWCAEIEGALGRKICGGLKSSDHTPCKGRPAANGRCTSRHAGKALSGPALPQYQGKGYGKYLSVSRGQELDRMLDSGDLVSVRDELGIAGLMHADLVSELVSLEAGGATFEDLRDSFAEIEGAVTTGDPVGVARALRVHADLLASGLNAGELREEIRKSGDHIARLAKTERQRMETVEETMTKQQVMGILAHFVDQVRNGVEQGLEGSEILRHLASELRRLVSPGKSNGEIVA